MSDEHKQCVKAVGAFVTLRPSVSVAHLSNAAIDVKSLDCAEYPGNVFSLILAFMRAARPGSIEYGAGTG